MVDGADWQQYYFYVNDQAANFPVPLGLYEQVHSESPAVVTQSQTRPTSTQHCNWKLTQCLDQCNRLAKFQCMDKLTKRGQLADKGRGLWEVKERFQSPDSVEAQLMFSQLLDEDAPSESPKVVKYSKQQGWHEFVQKAFVFANEEQQKRIAQKFGGAVRGVSGDAYGTLTWQQMLEVAIEQAKDNAKKLLENKPDGLARTIYSILKLYFLDQGGIADSSRPADGSDSTDKQMAQSSNFVVQKFLVLLSFLPEEADTFRRVLEILGDNAVTIKPDEQGDTPLDNLLNHAYHAAIAKVYPGGEVSVNIDEGHTAEKWVRGFALGRGSFANGQRVLEQLEAHAEPNEKLYYAYCIELRKLLERSLVESPGINMTGIALSQTGCRVYQRILETPQCALQAEELERFVQKLLKHDSFEALITDKNANYIIQHILLQPCRPLKEKQQVLNLVGEKICFYATHVFARHVVQRCFDGEVVKHIVDTCDKGAWCRSQRGILELAMQSNGKVKAGYRALQDPNAQHVLTAMRHTIQGGGQFQ